MPSETEEYSFELGRSVRLSVTLFLIVCMPADDLCGQWFSNQFLPHNFLSIEKYSTHQNYVCWYANKTTAPGAQDF